MRVEEDTICDERLVGVDGDVLHQDLLLATTSMLVQPHRQQRNSFDLWAVPAPPA
jgi:hypothetical protein